MQDRYESIFEDRMTLNLSDDQSRAVRRGEPIRLQNAELGEVVIMPAATFESLADDRERRAWKQLGEKAQSRWGRENPYGA